MNQESSMILSFSITIGIFVLYSIVTDLLSARSIFMVMSVISIYLTSLALYQYAWSENQFSFTKPMFDIRQKILITEFDSDFTHLYPWYIRSARSSKVCFVGFVFDYVDYGYIFLDYGITPVCTIWKSQSVHLLIQTI